ncbi:MAG TPA: DUF4349 domain-containing protein, partial [Candidatus Binatia bacterium]
PTPTPLQLPTGPMVVRTANLSVETNEFAAARPKIDRLVQQTRGYIDRLTVADAGTGRRLTATLRVPSDQLDFALNELKTLGRLITETLNSSDVTSQYVDVAARLANARNTEQRLLGLLRDRAGNLSEVVTMEREIATVRENIERMEAQQKDLNNRVQFASIVLELAEEYHERPEPPQPSALSQVHSALVDGIHSAGENTMTIVLFLLRYGPAIAIWSVFLGFVVYAVWRIRRRYLGGE